MEKKKYKQKHKEDGVCVVVGGGVCMSSVVQYGIHLNQLQSSI